MNFIANLISLTVLTLSGGPTCRVCSSTIRPNDAFGQCERVCAPCRD